MSVEPFNLFRYLDERVFTYNVRELTDLGWFIAVLQSAVGRSSADVSRTHQVKTLELAQPYLRS